MARQAIYNKQTGEIIVYAGSRQEAREIAREFAQGEIETEENVNRRVDAVRRVKGERNSWSIGSDTNQKELNPSRDRIKEALSHYPIGQKVTVAIRGIYGGVEHWYGSTGTVSHFAGENATRSKDETFSEHVERIFLKTQTYKLEAVLQIVFMPAHEG